VAGEAGAACKEGPGGQMQSRVLVLQHIACESPGIYEDVLLRQGAKIWRVELDEGQSLPDWKSFDAIVAMGGPMSVNDDDALPWLASEKRLIAEAVSQVRLSGESVWVANCLRQAWGLVSGGDLLLKLE
jgi:hypothetical protein